MPQKFLQIHPKDNVLVALTKLNKGDTITWAGRPLQLVDDIPAKHKLAITPLQAGDPVFMYGVLVGKAQQSIPAGGCITTENLKHAAEPFDYHGVQFSWEKPDVSRFVHRTFNGYHRSDGRVGTANYWLFIPTVFCENRNLDVIREALVNELGYGVTDKYKRFTRQLAEAVMSGHSADSIELSLGQPAQHRVFEHVDGIKFLNHDGGCGGIRQDSAILGKLLAAYANHPNVGGITLLSLGCQHLQTNDFLAEIKAQYPGFDKPLYVFEQQQAGKETDLISAAIRKTFEGLQLINQQERKPAGLDKLCVGVKCGGSDGFSGISANPAVGYCADLMVGLGAKILLAEFPELCGAEQELIDRSVDEKTARKFIHLMRSYEAQAKMVGSGFDMNPSPGNIRDGLITDAMKSAGAAKKGGTSPVVEAVGYGGYAHKSGGLTLVCTPGSDVQATTGMGGAGATIQLFTTGLGTATGNPITPMVKLSTNNTLTERIHDIIDINCGGIITGEKTVEQSGEEILDYVIDLASGKYDTKAMILGQDDFIFWKRGVAL